MSFRGKGSFHSRESVSRLFLFLSPSSEREKLALRRSAPLSSRRISPLDSRDLRILETLEREMPHSRESSPGEREWRREQRKRASFRVSPEWIRIFSSAWWTKRKISLSLAKQPVFLLSAIFAISKSISPPLWEVKGGGRRFLSPERRLDGATGVRGSPFRERPSSFRPFRSRKGRPSAPGGPFG